jgi:hypothetical protein
MSTMTTSAGVTTRDRIGSALDGQLLLPGDAGYDEALDEYASGAYVNFVNDEGAEGVLRAYSPEKLTRLTAVKTAYDPDNVFHLNHNIRPTSR